MRKSLSLQLVNDFERNSTKDFKLFYISLLYITLENINLKEKLFKVLKIFLFSKNFSKNVLFVYIFGIKYIFCNIFSLNFKLYLIYQLKHFIAIIN